MKRIVVDVSEEVHQEVAAYAKKDRRTVRQIILMAVEEYMKQNPVFEDERK